MAKALMDIFPPLFKFKACGVMFIDKKSQDMFSIQFLTQEQRDKEKTDTEVRLMNQIKDFDNIVKYPKDTGCTGQAITLKKAVYFNKGKMSTYFSA